MTSDNVAVTAAMATTTTTVAAMTAAAGLWQGIMAYHVLSVKSAHRCSTRHSPGSSGGHNDSSDGHDNSSGDDSSSGHDDGSCGPALRHIMSCQ